MIFATFNTAGFTNVSAIVWLAFQRWLRWLDFPLWPIYSIHVCALTSQRCWCEHSGKRRRKMVYYQNVGSPFFDYRQKRPTLLVWTGLYCVCLHTCPWEWIAKPLGFDRTQVKNHWSKIFRPSITQFTTRKQRSNPGWCYCSHGNPESLPVLYASRQQSVSENASALYIHDLIVIVLNCIPCMCAHALIQIK